MSKRMDAGWAIFQHAIVNGGTAAVPTVGVETGKHFLYSANEIAMCLRIAHIYIGPELTKDDVKELLIANGLVAATGTGFAIIGTKVGQTVANEVLNWIPVIGWFFKGALATSITAALGVAFVKICEALEPA